VSWEKINVTIVCKPASHGSGLYLRVPKKLVEAYDLWAADVIEFTLERAKRPEPEKSDKFSKMSHSPEEGGRE